MQLRNGIMELLEAVVDRIEVSGTDPTWRVTGGSFESVVKFAREAYDDPVVVDRHDHSLWWRRVTLTVTTDPALAAQAPPMDSLADPPPEPERGPATEPAPPPASEPEDVPETTLEAMFAYQDEMRHSGTGIPRQRASGRHAKG